MGPSRSYPATPPWTLGRKVGSHPTTPPWTFAGNVGGGGGTLRVPPWGGTPGGVPCKVGLSTLKWLLLQERMELVKAVREDDVEKVEVRRLLYAFLSTESGPSRGVCLGLGQWTLDAVVARPIRPCCVESSPYVRHHSGNFEAACRRSSVPVRTSRSVTRTLPCRLAESHNFSPPPSPAIAVSATF